MKTFQRLYLYTTGISLWSGLIIPCMSVYLSWKGFPDCQLIYPKRCLFSKLTVPEWKLKPYTKSNSPIHEKCLGVSKPCCRGRPPIVQEGATNMELHSYFAYREAEMTGVGNWGPVYEWPKKGRTGLRSSFVVGPLCKASSRELAVWTRNYHG